MSGTGNEKTATEAWSEGDAPPRAMPPPDDGGLLIIDIDGFEGPLDLLLELARHHKIDLKHISILKLAEQYLAFIEKARRLQLELAADYLVMAASSSSRSSGPSNPSMSMISRPPSSGGAKARGGASPSLQASVAVFSLPVPLTRRRSS